MEICNRYNLPKNNRAFWAIGITAFVLLVVTIVISVYNGDNSYSSSGNNQNNESDNTENVVQTKIELAQISTISVTEITEVSAKVSAELKSDGGGSVAEYGICYSTYSNPTIMSNTKIADGQNDNFTITLSNLSPNTIYYVRAYATNEAGTAYGEEGSFTTKNKQINSSHWNDPIEEETTVNTANMVESKNGTFTDSRDGKTYKTIKISNKVWMAENLAYKPSTGSYWDYKNNQDIISQYGYLYDWETACKVCPVGWHLPSKNELNALLYDFGGQGVNTYNALINGGGSGFSSLLGGLHNPNGKYYDFGESACFWSSTSGDNNTAWSLQIDRRYKNAINFSFPKDLGFSVRCIKD